MRTTKLIAVAAAATLVLAACGSDDATSEATADACSNTIDDGMLTIATGNPAFYPWVIDDTPESGQGFEAAVALAVGTQMGYSGDAVTWVRTDFDAAIQPGAKDFDFNLQQFTITDERKATVDFSDPYYTANQAIVALNGSSAEGATSIADLKDVKFGAQAGTTSFAFITDVIQPTQDVFAYDDNVGAKAALEANQIDAAVFDLPTALYVSGVEIDGSSVVGQFPAATGGTTDEFGLLLEKDSPLTPCVNAAVQALSDSGELAAITNEWLSEFTGAPTISE
ncbi:ABC transporter substrate-binding protein [uncultured Ilumatobacter sp.]|uniref:ABC transporter substrate-binding protein n=1 Tax=uncultured Ilumatobacter sp. TaxID=879968 RepID=UPI00374EF1B7